jgi:DNA-binding protein HU-beta
MYELFRRCCVTKTELVSSVAEKAELTKVDAERAVKALVETVTTCLKDGDSLTIVGFGTFSVSQRAARTGKNPRTGEKLEIAAANTPRFKAGKSLKDAVN